MKLVLCSLLFQKCKITLQPTFQRIHKNVRRFPINRQAKKKFDHKFVGQFIQMFFSQICSAALCCPPIVSYFCTRENSGFYFVTTWHAGTLETHQPRNKEKCQEKKKKFLFNRDGFKHDTMATD